jgi:hypothetical protein
MKPRVRKDLIARSETAGVLRLHDPHNDRLIELEPAAALVFELADGTRGIDELVRALRDRVDPNATPETAWQIVDALADEDLLAERLVPPAGETISRRSLFGRIAAAGAALAATDLALGAGASPVSSGLLSLPGAASDPEASRRVRAQSSEEARKEQDIKRDEEHSSKESDRKQDQEQRNKAHQEQQAKNDAAHQEQQEKNGAQEETRKEENLKEQEQKSKQQGF